jgi:Tol biopolymer transport system component
MPAEGGEVAVRASFQSETPSWDPTGAWLGITYGTWRRQVDDFRYPDIAQDAGIIASEGNAPASAPDRIVQDSPSEDQGMTWSPNGKWIAFHSHQQQSDDIWMRPADNSAPAYRATRLGRGAETGWPRWSPDGRWIAFDGDTLNGALARSLLWIIGADQETGQVTTPLHAIPLGGLTEDVLHAEWKGGSDRIVFTTAGDDGTHALYEVGLDGGAPRLLYRWHTTQRYDGFGVSPDGSAAAIVQPAADGRLQIFRVALDGGSEPVQLTTDATDKTQPSWSPDGRRIAFTIWRYESSFYAIRP